MCSINDDKTMFQNTRTLQLKKLDWVLALNGGRNVNVVPAILYKGFTQIALSFRHCFRVVPGTVYVNETCKRAHIWASCKELRGRYNELKLQIE